MKLTSRWVMGPATLLVVAALAACGATTTVGVEPTPSTRPTSSIPEGSVPTGADQVVIRVNSCCGLVPFGVGLRYVPRLSVFGDGTTVVPAAQGPDGQVPAVTPLRRGHLSRAQILDLLSAADEAGLLGDEIDFGSPAVTDVPSTTVTLVVDGHTYRQSAYALHEDFEDHLPAPAREARDRLRDFLTEAERVVGRPDEAFRPERVTVFAIVPGRDGGDLSGPIHAWPLEDPAVWPEGERARSYRCRTFEGSDADAVLAFANPTAEGTLWQVGEDRYRLVFRPLLPDETDGCAR